MLAVLGAESRLVFVRPVREKPLWASQTAHVTAVLLNDDVTYPCPMCWCSVERWTDVLTASSLTDTWGPHQEIPASPDDTELSIKHTHPDEDKKTTNLRSGSMLTEDRWTHIHNHICHDVCVCVVYWTLKSDDWSQGRWLPALEQMLILWSSPDRTEISDLFTRVSIKCFLNFIFTF